MNDRRISKNSYDYEDRYYSNKNNYNGKTARSESFFKIQDKIKFNYLPQDQSKHIDFVIYYKDSQENEKNIELHKARFKFINQLIEQENFEIQKIVKQKEETTSTYLLLHCPLKRLMKEVLCYLKIYNYNIFIPLISKICTNRLNVYKWKYR
jgi:hypothetical protein